MGKGDAQTVCFFSCGLVRQLLEDVYFRTIVFQADRCLNFPGWKRNTHEWSSDALL